MMLETTDGKRRMLASKYCLLTDMSMDKVASRTTLEDNDEKRRLLSSPC